MQSMRWLGFSLTAACVLLGACGHSGSNAPASVTLSYSAPMAVFIKGTEASVDFPTVLNGTVTAYTVTPTLPAGLALDPHTGMIAGIPTVVAAQASYTVTAWYTGGSTTAALSITVNDQKPSALSYTANAPTYIVGLPITANLPTNSGGTVVSYSVSSPNLPAGLSLSTTSGIISGTPSAAVAAASYTVTATNSGGSTTAALTITVNASPLATAPATGLSYSVPAPVYATGVPIVPDSPMVGPAGVSYAITPDLPQGLSMDTATGTVSGTPSAAPSPTASPVTVDYQVTAGSFKAPLTITLYNTSPAIPSVGQSVPNMNQFVTPLAPANSIFQFLDTGLQVSDPLNTNIPTVEWMAGQAVSTAISPDGTTLLVLTSGFNRVFQADSLVWDWEPDPVMSSEYVFIYNIANHTPVFQQVVKVPNAYHGLAWDPVVANHTFYVSGGMGDSPYGSSLDNVHIFTQDQTTSVWAQVGELPLGHTAGNGIPAANQGVGVNSSVSIEPCAAGVGISSDGNTLVVANYQNDSITIFTKLLGNWSSGTELDLRPGKAASNPLTGTPGGEYPFWVVVTGAGANPTAYISSLRDREIDVVQQIKAVWSVTARIPVKGQPTKMTANKAGTLLYVAEDESDTVDVININSADTGVPLQPPGPATLNSVIQTIPVIAPPAVMSSLALTQFTGANTNSVALSPDENTLYVTNGNLNNVAVVPLTGPNSGTVTGLIPTGWYPNSVSISSDSTWAYVVNSKSPTGPNPNWCYFFGPPGYPTCIPTNEYNPELTKAGLQSFPIPSSQLNTLTNQVIANNHFAMPTPPDPIMQAVHAGIQHVIYILKENRTYDQMLGDLNNASNGDPSLTLFGQAITPNQHALALNFVTLDNFMDTAEVSYDGWPWSTSARAPDVVEHQFPVQYASRGMSLDSEGSNRSVNVGLPTLAQRLVGDPLLPDDPDLLPGQADLASPDGPDDEENTGYLWNNALRAGLTVRNYGFFLDAVCYNAPKCQIPLAENPFSTNTIVAYPANAALAPFTDPYFRGFDLSFPDYYRYKEWEREFDTNYAAGGLPNLSLVRFMHDHTGGFATAIDGVNTPDREEADNDYAVGLLVAKIANSIYRNNTLIFIVEDDAQDGGDHVDSHRSTLYVAGAYVRQQAVVSNAHNTIDLVRTMEEVLGLGPMNLNDALARPMSDVFNTYSTNWSFTATPAAVLYCTSLPLPSPAIPCNDPTPNAHYWARVTKGMDFTDADRVDGAQFNRILWKGLMGNRPYPSRPTGKDLRLNREQLLARYQRTSQHGTALAAKPVKN
jgi:DNA-binding beta-propeller fold protein YncE